jgi:hypothetical protein
MMISMHADNPELGPGSFSHIGSNPFINPSRYGTYQSSLNNRDDPYRRDSVTLLEDGRDDTSAWAKKFNSAGASAHTQVIFLLDLKSFKSIETSGLRVSLLCCFLFDSVLLRRI